MYECIIAGLQVNVYTYICMCMYIYIYKYKLTDMHDYLCVYMHIQMSLGRQALVSVCLHQSQCSQTCQCMHVFAVYI